jgi:ATP-dependent Clp endopeptidase proteolytic subunit ClpP
MKTIRLDGVVGWDILAADVAAQLEGQSEVKVILNSGGGDVTEGFSIYNAFKDFAGKIEMSVDFAASMASLIAMAGDTITMKDNSSIMMIHRPWGGAGGNAEDLRAHADTLDKMEGMMLNIYSERSGLEAANVSDLLTAETYMDANEAKSFGFADTVESGKSELAMVAMSAMRSRDRVNFDSNKLVAKIDSMKSNKKPVRDMFNGCETLAKIESVMRQEMQISQSEATAIVSALRKVDHGDRDQKEVLSSIKNLKFKNI